MKLVSVERKDLRILYATALVYVSEHPEKDNRLLQEILGRYIGPALMEVDEAITH